MATNLLSFRLAGIYASGIPGRAKQDPNSRKSSAPPSSSASWWTPLFGWSSEPDYFDSDGKTDVKVKRELESETAQKPARSKFTSGSFTEEKARQLRMMTTNTKSFHDAMYHSAIASRLASDFKDRSDL
ncbi:SH3 and FCH domain-containing protein [Hibiscus syriacus]|uniref:SH3 and FCH domain-containing protein n=1 Tax=Hibiscus syriacus TaxID=106335 RepID=A0A6A3B0Z5_HIBSY|nr:SH3 and FCH domain-containing protein [Hibiscus syriacus]